MLEAFSNGYSSNIPLSPPCCYLLQSSILKLKVQQAMFSPRFLAVSLYATLRLSSSRDGGIPQISLTGPTCLLSPITRIQAHAPPPCPLQVSRHPSSPQIPPKTLRFSGLRIVASPEIAGKHAHFLCKRTHCSCMAMLVQLQRPSNAPLLISQWAHQLRVPGIIARPCKRLGG
jgi:hypothetical protein